MLSLIIDNTTTATRRGWVERRWVSRTGDCSELGDIHRDAWRIRENARPAFPANMAPKKLRSRDGQQNSAWLSLLRQTQTKNVVKNWTKQFVWKRRGETRGYVGNSHLKWARKSHIDALLLTQLFFQNYDDATPLLHSKNVWILNTLGNSAMFSTTGSNQYYWHGQRQNIYQR